MTTSEIRERVVDMVFAAGIGFIAGMGVMALSRALDTKPAPLTIEGVCRAVTVNDAPGIECRALTAPKL